MIVLKSKFIFPYSKQLPDKRKQTNRLKRDGFENESRLFSLSSVLYSTLQYQLNLRIKYLVENLYVMLLVENDALQYFHDIRVIDALCLPG